MNGTEPPWNIGRFGGSTCSCCNWVTIPGGCDSPNVPNLYCETYTELKTGESAGVASLTRISSVCLMLSPASEIKGVKTRFGDPGRSPSGLRASLHKAPV